VIALSTASLKTYDVARTFELAKDTGFEGIEIEIGNRWDTRQPDYLNRLKERYGLPIVSLHSPFEPKVEGWPTGHTDRCLRSIALAEEVGAKTVVVHPPSRVSTVQIVWPELRARPFRITYPYTWDKHHLHWLKNGLASVQAGTQVTIVIESMAYRRAFLGVWPTPWLLNTPEDWAQFPHWVMDTTHLGSGGFDVLALYEQLKSQLAHVHLSNYNGHPHRLLDEGRLPLAELLHRLHKDGFGGAVVCEFNPQTLGASDETVVRDRLRSAFEFCRENYA
jgi:sugar phosphate isomerase/epimerase